MTGYYRMHRGWMSHPAFDGEPFSERTAWIWLIEAAAWKATQRRVAGKVVAIKRGQLVGSVRYLATEWQWSKSRVARFLAILRDCEMIRTGTDSGTDTGTANGTRKAGCESVITICNYDKYQATPGNDPQEAGQQAGQIRDRGEDKEKEVNNLDISKKVDQLLSTLGAGKRPGAYQRPNYDDPKERKARWQQKIIDEIRRTLPDQQAGLIIASYSAGEREGKQYFEMVDQRLKARRAQTENAA